MSTLSLYLFEIYQSCASSALPLIQAHAALKWFHSFIPNLGQNPLDNEFCKNIIESSRCIKAQAASKKRPLSSQIIKVVIDVYCKEESNLKDLRVAALCSLTIAGFFSVQLIEQYLPSHTEFHTDYARIFVPPSETDVYREGYYVYMCATGTCYFPVSFLRKYMDVTGIGVDRNLPLFRLLVHYRVSATYSRRNGKLSYTSCREIPRDTLKKLAFNPEDCGVDSLRSGGITSVVHNSSNSVPEKLLKLHGRWKTDAAKDMEERLEVMRHLGL